MVEVTQNMDLRELSTGDELLRSITKLTDQVDKRSSPDLSKRKSSADGEMRNGLAENVLQKDVDPVSPIDSIGVDKVQNAENALPSERNAGTDLDALLDKISSIVNCDPKDSVDEDEESAEAVSTPIAPDIDETDKVNPGADEAETNLIAAKTEQEEEQQVNSKENVTGKDSTETEEEVQGDLEKSKECEDEQKLKKVEDGAEEENELPTEEKGLEGADCNNSKKDTKTPTKSDMNESRKNESNADDELFLDALDTISSSDEFDTLIDAKSKDTKSSPPKKEDKNYLEDVSSDESNDNEGLPANKAKGQLSVIDLDSFDEVVAAEKAKHIPKKEEADKTILDDETEVDPIEKLLNESNQKRSSNIKAPAECNENETDSPAPTTNGLETSESVQDEDKKDEQATSKSSEKSEADVKETESDDEVIFFEPIDKTAKKLKETESETKLPKDMPQAEKKVDEVVLLSEDEEEQPPVKKEEELSESAETPSLDKPEDSKSNEALSRDLLADSSDNACDQFEKAKSQEKEKASSADDGNSNSSNLLQPSQKISEETPAETEPEAETEGDAEASAEAEDGDVEMVPDEPEDESETVTPAVKRIRLSTDDKPEASNSSQSGTTIQSSTASSDKEVTGSVTKRNHSLLATSDTSEKEEAPNKKLKTEDSDSNSSNDGTLQIDLDAHDNTHESEAETAPSEAGDKQLRVDGETKSTEPAYDLKPVPELKSDTKPVRMEFIRSFRKNFDKMTRHDLEELVLQKVVEAMLVKSEFAEIRRQIDNHELTLATYRRKIAEVSKQFLDLETVHKRVLKDLETKNAQFTAPVRITRAVGLQVGMALMKKPSDEARHQGSGSHAAGSMSAPSSSMHTPPRASTSPMRSPMRGVSQSRTGLSPPQQQHHQQQYQQQQQQQHHHLQQQQQQTPTATRPYVQTSGGAPQPVRRGCMQKITPQRPVNNTPSSHQQASSSSVTISPAMQRLPGTPVVTSRPMYSSKHTGGSTSMNAAAVAATMRARGTTAKPINKDSTYMAQKQQQHQHQQQQLQQQHHQQQQQPLPVRIGRMRMPSRQQQQQAISINSKRSMPTVSVPISNSSENPATSAAAGGYGQPSLTPARPKEKAVIDLTDEDDAAAAAAAAAVEATSRLRQSQNVSVKRTTQTSQMGSNARQTGGNVVRVSPMNIPRANAVARQIVNGPVQRGSIGSNVTMQIRSENTPPSGSRARLSHPAPLPVAPPQTFHAEWKLPPSRPVIRISLHDMGIVISWTLEDTGSRFAECVTYQIYAYQETINEPSTDSWRHVGDVKAMLLPMAVTLNQFQENQRYFFAVRGVDAHNRYGLFSVPKTW